MERFAGAAALAGAMAPAALAMVALVLAAAPAAGAAPTAAQRRAQDRMMRMAAEATPQLYPGAVELGVAGSFTAVEGSVRSVTAARVGTFVLDRARARAGALFGMEAEVAHEHVGGLDLVDAEGQLTWQQPVRGTSLYPFLAAGGGVRQEWLGSFAEARYPVGGGVGLRVLAAARAGMRVEYRYRRILKDPVRDFTEHQVLVGLSVFLRNPR